MYNYAEVVNFSVSFFGKICLVKSAFNFFNDVKNECNKCLVQPILFGSLNGITNYQREPFQ